LDLGYTTTILGQGCKKNEAVYSCTRILNVPFYPRVGDFLLILLKKCVTTLINAFMCHWSMKLGDQISLSERYTRKFARYNQLHVSESFFLVIYFMDLTLAQC